MKSFITEVKDNGDGYTDVTITCELDGTTDTVKVPTQGFYEWNVRGVHIQKAMPNVSTDDREMLITGICHECVADTYANFEEEDED